MNLTLTQAASANGLSKSGASNLTRLLDLPEPIQQQIATGKMSQRHGRELLRLVAAGLSVGEIIDFSGNPRPDDEVDEDMYNNLSTRHATEAVSAYLSKMEQATRARYREMRYCPVCAVEREFTGTEIDQNGFISCDKCNNPYRLSVWPTELPTKPVTLDDKPATLNGKDYGNCAVCETPLTGPGWTHADSTGKVCDKCSGQHSTVARQRAVDRQYAEAGYTVRWCPDCGGERQFYPAWVKSKITLICPHCDQQRPAADWLQEQPQEHEPAAAEAGAAAPASWDDEIWICHKCGKEEPKAGEVAGWTLNGLKGFTCRQCWDQMVPGSTAAIQAAKPPLQRTAEAELDDGKLHLTIPAPDGGLERRTLDISSPGSAARSVAAEPEPDGDQERHTFNLSSSPATAPASAPVSESGAPTVAEVRETFDRLIDRLDGELRQTLIGWLQVLGREIE